MSEFQVSTTADRGYRAGNSVSATRIDTPIKDLPFTVSAFTEQFITDIGAIDLQDIMRFAPGVTSGDKSFVAGNNRFSIRGFDGDVPPQRNGFTGNRNVDAANVTRVEVIKGPASLLYGQIIPGGSINYITKRPTPKAFESIKVSVGNFSDYRAVLDVNVPAGSRLAARVVGSYDQAPQWAETGETKSYLFAPSLSAQLAKNVTLIVDYEKLRRVETPPVGMMPNVQIAGLSGAPSASTFVNVAARSYQQGLFDAGAINEGFLGTLPIASTFNYQGNNDYKKSTYENLNIELNVKLGSHWVARANYSWNTRDVAYKLTGLAQWDVTPTAAYRTATTSYFDYLKEYQANPSAVLADPTKTTSVLLNRRKRIQTSSDGFNTYQADFSGKYQFGGVTLNPLLGVYRQNSRTGGGTTLSSSSGYGSYSDTNGALPFTPWNYFDPSTWNRSLNYNEYSLPVASTGGFTYGLEQAYYGVLTAKLLDDRLIMVGGARYDRFQSGGAASYSYDVNKTTPQVGVGYHVTKDSLLFANYSKSFLVEGTTVTVENPNYNPAINLNSSTNPNFIRQPASPTTGLGYEAGLKTDFLHGRISSTLTLFHLERADRFVTVRQPVVGLGTTGLLTTTEVTFSKQGTVDQSEGVEFELTYSPLDNWQVYATYAGMNIKTTKVTAPTMRLATDAKVAGDYASYVKGYNDAISLLKGAVPEGSAERLASLWTRYTFKQEAVKGLWIAGGGNYTSPKAQRSANPTLFFADYYLFDAAIGYDWKHEKQAWNVALNIKNIGDKVYYPANQARGRPRQFVLSASTKF
jgi:iron complex outermembrane receptor protein